MSGIKNEAGINGHIAQLARAVHGPPIVGAPDPAQVLEEMTSGVVDLVPAVDSASVTLVRKRNKKIYLQSTAATDPAAEHFDVLQQTLGDGPCFEAIWTDNTIRIDDMTSESRWRTLTAAVTAETPIRSSLAIQLYIDGLELGALNLYANTTDAFDATTENLAINLATHAAIALSGSRSSEQFRSALASRDIIGQAKGRIMERYDVDAVQAFTMLRKLSQDTNIALAEVAQRLIDADPPAHRTTDAPTTPSPAPSSDSREPVMALTPQEQTIVDGEDDLAEAVSGLSQLSTGALTLTQALTAVAEYGVKAIPGADGVGVTLLQEGRPDTVVASADFVREVDNIQYSLGEGPCITAATSGATIRSGALHKESRWPTFATPVGDLGVHSVLALPLVTPAGVIGALNVYAYLEDAFDERAAQLGELFAVPAAVAVGNARALAAAVLLTQRLEMALTNRATIDHAIGILIARSGYTSTEAFHALRTISQHENRKLNDVAHTLVEEAAGRARARRGQQPE